MGQYHKVVNLSKREYITPYEFGHGAKLMEFGQSGVGFLFALSQLLLNDWKGDRIAIVGDYGQPGDIPAEILEAEGLADSELTLYAIAQDVEQLRAQLVEDDKNSKFSYPTPAKVEDYFTVSEGYVDGEWKERFDPKGFALALTFRNAGKRARHLCWKTGILRKLTDAERGSYYTRPGWMLDDAKLTRENVASPAIYNHDKNAYITNLGFGDVGSFTEGFALSYDGGVLTALAVLLASANKGGARGGGDFRLREESDLVGSWAGDHLSIMDEAELPEDAQNMDESMRNLLSEADEGEYHVFSEDGRVIRKIWTWNEDRTDYSHEWSDEVADLL